MRYLIALTSVETARRNRQTRQAHALLVDEVFWSLVHQEHPGAEDAELTAVGTTTLCGLRPAGYELVDDAEPGDVTCALCWHAVERLAVMETAAAALLAGRPLADA